MTERAPGVDTFPQIVYNSTTTATNGNIDEYIAQFPPEVQQRLCELRAFLVREVKAALAEAGGAECAVTEIISYDMPCLRLNGNLFYYAAFKKHYGFFPCASGVRFFEESLPEAVKYKRGKGSLGFGLDEPFPWDVLQKIVKFRVNEDLTSAAAKKGKKRG